VSGAKYPTITHNTFKRVDRAIQIMPWKNTNHGKAYSITYNKISTVNQEAMLSNTLKDMSEYSIRYNKVYDVFDLDTEKWEIYNSAVTEFTVTTNSETFQNNFHTYSTYNSQTKPYYMLRSYLEQLENVGGGTLTITAGVYNVSNTLYVPSNVTINFEDGVVIKKTTFTGIDDMASSKSIFQLVTPSKSTISGAYSGYNGETNIHFVGKGIVIIDLNFTEDGIGIVCGHNSNVSISGITFQNMYSGHFIELDASTDVTIHNNIFKNHKNSIRGIKEAINIDTPDRNTGGFNAVWTSYDCTPNKNIVIQNNCFYDLERAIGTHKYSAGKYHENIQILNNTIENTDSDAIRIMNWTRPVIKGNTIKNVGTGTKGTDRAILASGMTHPIITDNTFIDVAKPIQIMPWKNSDSNLLDTLNGGNQYDIIYNEIDAVDISLMLKNYLVRVNETFIRYNHTYNVFESNTEKYNYTSEYIRYTE
jgi:hypothetical protein